MSINDPAQDAVKAALSLLEPRHIAELLTKRVGEPRICANCGATVASTDKAHNVMVVAKLWSLPAIETGVVGHGAVPGFQCPDSEHWACSPKCWAVVAHKCVDEDMLPLLQAIYDNVNNAASKDNNAVTVTEVPDHLKKG